MTDIDSSSLQEPLLPSGDDHHEDEEDLQRRSQTQNSGVGEYGQVPGGEARGRNDDGDSDGNLRSQSLFDRSSYPPEFFEVAENNVRRSLAIIFGDLAAKSIWSQNLLSIFVILVWRDRPEFVGVVQATSGLFQTISTEFTNWVTRRFNHGMVLVKLASLAGLCVTVISLCAIAIQNPNWEHFFPQHDRSKFGWFLLANGLWGVFWGILETALSILLVESASVVPRTTLPKIREWHRRVKLGGFFGTLLGLAIFFKLDNEWTIQSMGLVLMCGVGCNLFGVVTLCFLKSVADDDWDEDNPDDGFLFISPPESEEQSFLDEVEPSRGTTPSQCCPDKLLVPLLIYLSDAFSSLAGGMSAWYFPVFLVKVMDIRPIGIQCVYLAIPVGQWFSPSLAEHLARAIGPCRTCILMQWMYVGLLLSMLAYRSKGYLLVCALYVLHGSLMNSTSQLSKNLISDYVPIDDPSWRFWDWAKTFQKMLWSFAGLLGAYLVTNNRWGLLANFYATAFVQFLACLPLVVLYCLRDPRLEEDVGDEGLTNESSSSPRGENEDNALGGTSLETTNGSREEEPATQHGSKTTEAGKNDTSFGSTQATEPDDSDDTSYYSMASTTWVV